MPRVKRGTSHVKRRKNILKRAKGFNTKRKKIIKLAKPALFKAGQYAYNSRKTKKRTMRRLWLVKINAAVRELGMSYSQLIGLMKKKNVEIDRKVLSQIGEKNPIIFSQVIDFLKK